MNIHIPSKILTLWKFNNQSRHLSIFERIVNDPLHEKEFADKLPVLMPIDVCLVGHYIKKAIIFESKEEEVTFFDVYLLEKSNWDIIFISFKKVNTVF